MPRTGLDAAAVTEAGAAVADDLGLDRLSMSVVAERLGVKPPSLYKHVDSLATLIHRIATLGATEVGDILRDAVQGVAGREALAAAAQALRRYVKQYPGRYAATTGARPISEDEDDPLVTALERALAPLEAVLHGYQLDTTDKIHALRDAAQHLARLRDAGILRRLPHRHRHRRQLHLADRVRRPRAARTGVGVRTRTRCKALSRGHVKIAAGWRARREREARSAVPQDVGGGVMKLAAAVLEVADDDEQARCRAAEAVPAPDMSTSPRRALVVRASWC